MEIFYFLTKYVQSRLLHNCCMRERVNLLSWFSISFQNAFNVGCCRIAVNVKGSKTKRWLFQTYQTNLEELVTKSVHGYRFVVSRLVIMQNTHLCPTWYKSSQHSLNSCPNTMTPKVGYLFYEHCDTRMFTQLCKRTHVTLLLRLNASFFWSKGVFFNP